MEVILYMGCDWNHSLVHSYTTPFIMATRFSQLWAPNWDFRMEFLFYKKQIVILLGKKY